MNNKNARANAIDMYRFCYLPSLHNDRQSIYADISAISVVIVDNLGMFTYTSRRVVFATWCHILKI